MLDLVQHLDPSLNFGQVRQVLRPLVGLSPRFPEALRISRRSDPDRSLQERWVARARLRRGSPAWSYLAETRCLPPGVLTAAAEADVVREGSYGGVWFAHRDGGTGLDQAVCHIEVRGPNFKGSLRGGTKTVFRFGGIGDGVRRIAVTEVPIDALSLAAVEGVQLDTLYVATGGGMGPRTVQAIERLLRSLSGVPGPSARLSTGNAFGTLPTFALLVSATDANTAGERYAARHAELAAAAGIPFARLRPTMGSDWNDVIAQRRRA